MRLDEFVKDAGRVDALKHGVRVMKAREPSDPLSWFFQAAIHAVRPAWVDEARQRDSKVAQVDQARFWNQCPHWNQTSSADFLVWHRAYVYYFERILREAAQDPSLSLPYWNYTDTRHRRFPSLFADPDVDPITQQARNPLYDPRRELAFVNQLYELSDHAVAAPLATKEFFGATEIEGFAGGVADQDRNTKGEVEVSPHDQLHFAIGGVIGFGSSAESPSFDGGLMASVPTAAFDPIFWVHHCNIDRLWSAWDCLKDRVWGTPPARDWFTARPWWFYDADRQPKNLERAHYIRHGTLGITFDTDDPTCRPMSTTLPYDQVAVAPTATLRSSASTVGQITVVRRQELGHSNMPLALSATAPVSRSVALAIGPVFGEASVRDAVTMATASSPRRVLLELQGIVLKSTPSVRYDVFVNRLEGGTPSRIEPSYVGTLSLFGAEPASDGHVGHGTGGAGGSSQQFDVTNQLQQPGFDPASLKVTIAPVDLLNPLHGAPPLRRDGGIRIGSMRLIVVEGRAEASR
jgi:hypothetical protein